MKHRFAARHALTPALSQRERGFHRSIGTLAAVVGLAVAVLATTWSPAGYQAAAQTASSERDVSANLSLGERAIAIVRVLGQEIGVRPAGTDAERRAATYLADELSAMGYAAEVVPFDYASRSDSGTSQNVVARDPNEDPALPLVIIGAHYDSVPMGPGANDNGSGTATMVEVARQLSWFPVSGVAVRYVAFGAEEVGLRGSAHYVRNLSPADVRRIRVAMSLDMLAVGANPAFAGSDPWVFEALARAESQGYRPVDLSRPLRRMSDHASFLDAGVPAILLHWVEDPFYHTVFDVADNVQIESLELMGAIAIELVRVAAR